MNILLTGFEPFGGDPSNPSWEVAQALDGWQVRGGGRVHARALPTAFETAPQALQDALSDVQPGLVVALGLACGRAELALERVAINLIDARIPDNRGSQPREQAVRPEGPAAYFSTLPLAWMQQGLHAAGHPATLSLSAGAFVCNQVFYELQHALRQTPTRSGFIHLPASTMLAVRKGAGTPSMSLSMQVEAIRIALTRAVEFDAALHGTLLSGQASPTA